jgi:signal transduction histidine kinase
MLLFILFQNPPYLSVKNTSNRIQLASEILAYTSLILNISACASCFILLDRLGDVPYRAARKPSAPQGGKVIMPPIAILRVYGVGALWRWAVWHWLICFLFGFWSIIAQILLFVWTQLNGNRHTAIAVSALAVFCLLPWIAFTIAPLVNSLTSVRATEDEEASFVAADDRHPFPRYDSYRLSGVGRSPQEPYRPSFAGPPPILRSPVGRINDTHSPIGRNSPGDHSS